MSLKELIAKATKGPWKVTQFCNSSEVIVEASEIAGRSINGPYTREVLSRKDYKKKRADAELIVYLHSRAPAIAELIEAAEAVGAHPFVYFGTDTLPGPDSGQHKIAALRKALEAMKCS